MDKEEKKKGMDMLWYIWINGNSPVFGKDRMTTFERYLIADKETHKEVKNPYYTYMEKEETVNQILEEFGLDAERFPYHQRPYASEGIQGRNACEMQWKTADY